MTAPALQRVLLVATVVHLVGGNLGLAARGGNAALLSRPMTASRDWLGSVGLAFESKSTPSGIESSFIARGRGYQILLDQKGVRVASSGTNGSALRMAIAGASRRAMLVAEEPTGGISNYFIGNDPKRHRVNVPHFRRVRARGVYPGIDLVYYGNQSRLEYDFVVAPGADPAQVRLQFGGQTSMHVSDKGGLVLRMGSREIEQTRPVAYQDPDRTPVDVHFALRDDGAVGLVLGTWDRSRTLVIDPVIVFGTYLGGSNADTARAVATDGAGNIYVAGDTWSADFPTVGPFQGSRAGIVGDAFVTKISGDGSNIIYSTYLGGTGASSVAVGIAVDSSGNALITGSPSGDSFPHSGPLTDNCASGSAFITKLAPLGNALSYSVCFRGTGSGITSKGISVDGNGVAHVTGVFSGPLSTLDNVFISALNASGDAWVYFTDLTGSFHEQGSAIASDNAGNVCVTGSTGSTNFPVMNALQPTRGPSTSAFAAKYDAAGNAIYVTYLGGSDIDEGLGAAIDGAGNCYFVGKARSTDFPLHNPAQSTNAGEGDVFITAYNTNGSAYLYSTYLGGTKNESAPRIAVTGAGIAHVAGVTQSRDLQVKNQLQFGLTDVSSVLASTNEGANFSRRGMVGEAIQALAIDPTDAQVMYAGTPGGVYKSANGGVSWTRVDSGLTYYDVHALAIDPNDHCAVYAGVETNVSSGLSPPAVNTTGVLAFSPDCGTTWGVSAAAPSGRKILSLAFTNSNPAALYASVAVNAFAAVGPKQFATTHYRVYRYLSGNGIYQFTNEDGQYTVATDRFDPCVAYLGGLNGKVWQNSSCGSFNWTQIGSTLAGWVHTIAPHALTTGSILVGTDKGRIYRKSDSGTDFAGVTTTNGDVMSIVYQPGSTLVAYAGTTAGLIYKSTDGGLTWNVASRIGPAVLALAVSAASPSFVGAISRNDTDAFYARVSASGQIVDLTWVGGAGADAATSVAVDSNGSAIIAGTTAVAFPVTPGAAMPAIHAGGDAFVVKINPALPSLGPETVSNGQFSAGFAGWSLFATPDSSYISTNVVNGVLEFYRNPPPPGGSNSAVVLYQTGVSVPAGHPLLATFDVGNSSTVRKRVSVLIHDQNFSDLAVCTFWLPAAAPLRTYRMFTHTTQSWNGATISFYAATAGSDDGAYLLDNVSLVQAPQESPVKTTCDDPLAPVPPGGVDQPELISNGGFGAGLTSWNTFGQIVGGVSSGVFEFYRPSASPDPAGVILQPTGAPIAAGQIITARFDLGNSSSVRRRVTVLLHDLDFSDLAACTFWLDPGLPLTTYAMRTFVTDDWTNATFSMYAATPGDEVWTRLDNVSVRKTPGSGTNGTDCVEAGGTLPTSSGPIASISAARFDRFFGTPFAHDPFKTPTAVFNVRDH
jgi:Beta-propeller repeat